MPDSTNVVQIALNYSFLLITHIVCADQQIHSEEARGLRDLAKKADINQQTLDEMEKILAQDEQQISLEATTQAIPHKQRVEALQQVLAIAYIDGFCSPLEQAVIEQISQSWKVPSETIKRLLIRAESFSSRGRSNINEQQELSFGARLLQGADSVLSRSLVTKLAEIAPGNISRKVEQLRREILFAGPEYDEIIQRCALVANEDYKFAEIALKSTFSTLQNLGQNIQRVAEGIQDRASSEGRAANAKEVIQQLEGTRRSLSAQIIKDLENVRDSLHAKQRALNHFSIAFMGKTKAGKSTLHAIVTGEGWEAIGIGMQRTTRYNRVYEWKNIRIIDTPGIGAPGGKTDEEIAKSIAPEADVVCYVVTNDSIQESEFDCLRFLKEETKPLIILLNVKQNLRDSRRLEHFLKDPNKSFSMDGKSGLSGHIERIRRYARQHYANDYFPIVPVMLIAAQIASETEDQKRKKQLFVGSRLQDFLDSIRESLIKYGVIRRSQTLLGSTVSAINNPSNWINKELAGYEQFIERLKSKQESLQSIIQKSENDAWEQLEQEIKAIFQDVTASIQTFAENYWDLEESKMQHKWNEQLKGIRFEEKLKNAYEAATHKFEQGVRETLEEIGKELILTTQLEMSGFNFTTQDSVDVRFLLRIASGVFTVAALAFATIPPIAIALGIAATIASILINFLKTKAQKRSEAIRAITTTLSTQLEQQEQNVLKQAEDSFRNSCSSVVEGISHYFIDLIQALEEISSHLKNANGRLLDSANYLNRAYAKRILDWCLERYEPLTEQNINKSVSRVQRDFGRNMTIYTRNAFNLRKSQDELKLVLQEDISIQTSNLK